MRKRPRGKQNVGQMAAERILSLRERHEPSGAFARRIGVPAKTLNNYYRGESGASVEVLATVVRTAHVNAHWLLTGEGPRYQLPEERRERQEQDRVMRAAEQAQALAEELRRIVDPEPAHAEAGGSGAGGANRNRGESESSGAQSE